jgi:hypothetical protein
MSRPELLVCLVLKVLETGYKVFKLPRDVSTLWLSVRMQGFVSFKGYILAAMVLLFVLIYFCNVYISFTTYFFMYNISKANLLSVKFTRHGCCHYRKLNNHLFLVTMFNTIIIPNITFLYYIIFLVNLYLSSKLKIEAHTWLHIECRTCTWQTKFNLFQFTKGEITLFKS